MEKLMVEKTRTPPGGVRHARKWKRTTGEFPNDGEIECFQIDSQKAMADYS
jgi:hypothetical protein